MLFLVFALLVVTELFSKSRSDTLHDSMSPRLRPVPKARRILIRSAGNWSDAESSSCCLGTQFNWKIFLRFCV